MPFNFNELFETLKEGVISLAKDSFSDFVKEAKSDGKNFLDSTKEKLERWTKLLAAGDITGEDFQFLILSQKDLAQMTALKEAGVTLIRIDQFKSNLINLVVNTVFTFLKL